MSDLLDEYNNYLGLIPDNESCENCLYWKLEPYKQRTGACLHRWMPGAKFDGDPEGGWTGCGAYGRTMPWDWCEGWEAAR